MLLEHLALARKHVADGERHVRRQREIVAELDRGAHDTSQGKDLLRLFEELQVFHVSHRDRLLNELSELPA
jgi:hypothetical protein